MTQSSTLLPLMGILLSLTAAAASTEPFRPDVTGKVTAEGVQDVDHLEPYEGAKAIEAKAAARTPWKFRYHYLAQFVAIPALRAEGDYLAVVLLSFDRRYLLQAAKIPTDKVLSKPPKPAIEIPIPESLASVVYDLWVNALLEVRYERRQHGVLDGETYLFSTFVTGLGWMHGSTASPGGDLPPVWMVQAGEKLLAFAREEKRDEKALEAELIVLRDKLFSYIRAHGKH